MAAQAQSTVVPTDAELLQAQAELWHHSLSYLTSMALKCAVELGIPTAIHRLGGAASVPDLITGLSLPSAKLPFLGRLMRLLATSGVFAADNSTQEEMYRINALSYLLVEGVTDDRHINHTSYVRTAASSRYIEAALQLPDWFKKDVPTPPFEHHHGVKLFHETMENHDPDYHKIANEALAAHDNFGVDVGLREFRDTFEALKSITYCCGTNEDDTTARAIVKAFPHIKCTVLAKPKVIATIPRADAVINYVAGDMLKFIPPAQAVVLKLVLHHLSDEDCVKILANCKKAIPSREDGGKVLFGDIVVDSSPGLMLETHLLMDVAMMTMTQGRERDENEWREIFMKAGFRDYKLVKKFGLRAVIEVYP
ncbi:hypothetical protein QOZ80_9AG0679150 [Eleusine coracana subsp. coracana]|nr:hypothetical protein QOZ80_9AG0679150 [Eleusine coracana subsp. coracana]